MSIIAWLIVGGIIGWLAAKVMGRNEGILASIVIGIIGSFIGGAIGNSITGNGSTGWGSIFWAFIGSVILVAIMNAIQGRRHHTPTY